MRDTYFSYEMHVKGSKENVQKFLESYNVSEDDIIYNEEFAEECIVHFCGDGDYTLDHGCLSDYRDYVDAQDKNLSRFSLKLRTMFLSLEAQIQEIHQKCDPYRSFHYYDKGKLKIEEYDDLIPVIEWDKNKYKTFEDLIESLDEFYYQYVTTDNVKESDFIQKGPSYFEREIDEYDFDF